MKHTLRLKRMITERDLKNNLNPRLSRSRIGVLLRWQLRNFFFLFILLSLFSPRIVRVIWPGEKRRIIRKKRVMKWTRGLLVKAFLLKPRLAQPFSPYRCVMHIALHLSCLHLRTDEISNYPVNVQLPTWCWRVTLSKVSAVRV